jgi:DNA-binding LacI/PurR family transcriptional regulator
MTSSAEVAARAGVSRSTVSQILNGHEHRFKPAIVSRVRDAAGDLGYRPSVAGRTLVRGTSDIVITLIPDITFGPRLRDLVDQITHDLSIAGYTNLLRLATSGESLEDAILGLRPRSVISFAEMAPDMRTRLGTQNVQIVEQAHGMQADIDFMIGEMQAEHLAEAGYQRIAVAMPTDAREQPMALSREAGALDWSHRHGIATTETLHFGMGRESSTTRLLPTGALGVAAYNDDVALAVVGAALRASRSVPQDVGVIGVDNSPVANVSTPTLTTINLDLNFSGHEIVKAVLGGTDLQLPNPLDDIRKSLSVELGESTAFSLTS